MGHACTTVVGTVVETAEGRARVDVPAQGCGRCHEPGGCGGGNLGQLLSSSPRTFWVANDVGARVGEQVEIGVAAGALSASANLAYGLPLLATVLGAVVGMQIGGELAAMACAGGALLGAVGVVRHRSKGGLGKPAMAPHIVGRRSP